MPKIRKLGQLTDLMGMVQKKVPLSVDMALNCRPFRGKKPTAQNPISPAVSLTPQGSEAPQPRCASRPQSSKREVGKREQKPVIARRETLPSASQAEFTSTTLSSTVPNGHASHVIAPWGL
ncbi:hypothetical protein P7K49_007874 [Saguinus oedipus]|uniref:Uncharacterized protein n=1 Tax=Saguinus oedipus TaxID=9490 RepID=A0ABQ9VW32_SAGOE|nr:hypothetical protein P7K49_007874 [Saguinus oedipus]